MKAETVYVVLVQEPEMLVQEALTCNVLGVTASFDRAKALVAQHAAAHAQPDVKEVKVRWYEPEGNCRVPVVLTRDVGRRVAWHEDHWCIYQICAERLARR